MPHPISPYFFLFFFPKTHGQKPIFHIDLGQKPIVPTDPFRKSFFPMDPWLKNRWCELSLSHGQIPWPKLMANDPWPHSINWTLSYHISLSLSLSLSLSKSMATPYQLLVVDIWSGSLFFGWYIWLLVINFQWLMYLWSIWLCFGWVWDNFLFGF